MRAKLAKTPEDSDYTSISQRLGRAKTTELPPLLLPFAKKDEPESLPYTFSDYLALVDWTGRAIRDDKRGHIPAALSPILERLQLEGDDWLKQVRLFKRSGIRAIGHGAARERYAHHCGQRTVSPTHHPLISLPPYLQLVTPASLAGCYPALCWRLPFLALKW